MEQISLRGLSFPCARQPLRVAGYARVSLAEELNEGSYENQRGYLRQEISNHPGWELVAVYGDYGRSGTQTHGRAGFQQMLRDALAGGMDVIITKSISRYARSAADAVASIRQLSAAGVTVYFIEQGFWTGAAYSELILTALASVAEMESQGLSENLRLVHRAMNAQGTPVIPARYGYRRQGKEWAVVPQQALCVQTAFYLAAIGTPYAQIAARLNAMEGGGWSETRLRRLLASEVYVGDILTNKRVYVQTDKGRAVRRNTGLEDQFYVRDHHPPLVGRAVYEALTALCRAGRRSGQSYAAARQAAEADPLLSAAREACR